jgi:RNA polymerase sigma-70 factor (ECF subfamily)
VSPETIERAQAGDRQALEELLRSHYEQVHRMLVHLVGRSPDIDDLRQSVLLTIVQNLHKFRGESALSSWVSGICVNVSRTHFRSKKRRSDRIVHESDNAREHAAPTDPVAQLESRDQLMKSEAALATLSPNQRAAFVLAAVYGHSVDEIAQIMGAARSTTRMRLRYGRKKFFRALEGKLA